MVIKTKQDWECDSKLISTQVLKETYPSASNIQPTIGDLSVQYSGKIVIKQYYEESKVILQQVMLNI